MNTQGQPVEDGSLDATDAEKLAGLVEQTRSDAALGSIPAGEESAVLKQRAAEAGLVVDDSELDALLG